jgi:hypothetical protein
VSSSSSFVTTHPNTKDENTTNITTTKPHSNSIFQNHNCNKNDHDDGDNDKNYYSLTIIQNSGETIFFVPSGWKHTFINIHGNVNNHHDNENDDMISINHN